MRTLGTFLRFCLFPLRQEKELALEIKTHRYTGVFHIEALPKELQLLACNLHKRSNIKELRSVIQKLCVWQPLTAQQLVEILKRKDKKHFVRTHLTPMVKEGVLKYLFPDDEDSPNQAYISADLG